MRLGYRDEPSVFQETMEKIFEPIIFEEFLSIYMDDILIKTNSEQEMINNLEKVFYYMKMGQIKADPSKCNFFRKEIKILGKLVSKKGIKIPDDYVKIIQEWKWLEGLESFNGRITWMLEFIPEAQEDLSQIRKVIMGKEPIGYKPAKEAFEQLKKKCIN